jgi:hypothetical protein
VPSESTFGLTRRSLTRGAVWTAPAIVVGVAAPAYAASCTSAYRLNWGTTPYTTSSNSGSATVSATSGGGTPVVVTFASTITGSVNRSSENLTVPATTNIGGLGAGERGLSLRHTNISSGRSNRQTVNITFSRPVTGLSFTFTDIDSNESWLSGDFWDRIELSGVRTFVSAANVTGQGTQAQPWYLNNDDNDLGDTSSAGNVTVTYAAAVTSITVVYWSNQAGGDQRVFLGDFTFTADCS